MALVQMCHEADFNGQTMTCTAPYWEAESTVLPTLSIADAQTIGMSIAFLWAVAWAFRRIAKFLNQS